MCTSSLTTRAGAGCENMTSRSADRNTVWAASNASPASSDSIRSGRSCITVLSSSCRSLDCHRGMRCSRCTHCEACPFSMHASQASWTW